MVALLDSFCLSRYICSVFKAKVQDQPQVQISLQVPCSQEKNSDLGYTFALAQTRSCLHGQWAEHSISHQTAPCRAARSRPRGSSSRREPALPDTEAPGAAERRACRHARVRDYVRLQLAARLLGKQRRYGQSQYLLLPTALIN